MLSRGVIPVLPQLLTFPNASRRRAARMELLQRQLNDLGWQVQGLLKEIARRQDPTIPSDEELEADEGTAPAGSIDKVITPRTLP
jgi:hypothetical protein